MATRRTRTAADGDPDLEPAAPARSAESDDAVPPLTAADRLALALQSIGEDSRAEVRIYKLGADDGFAWCETLSPEAYERSGYAALRTKWGAGEFKVALYGSTPGGTRSGTTGFGLRAWERITIAEDRTAPAPAASSTPSPDLARLQATVDQLAAAIAKRPEEPAAPPPDPFALMTQMFSLMKLMREADGVADRKPVSVLEVLKEMRALKETGADLFGDGPAEPPDPLSQALPGLLEIIKAQQAKGGGTIEPMPPVALPESVQPGHDAANEGNHDMQIDEPNQLIADLRKKLAAIIALADAGMDPEKGAEIVFEHLPDEMITLLEQPTWFEALVQFAPAAAPHREWLDQARQLALQWIADEAKNPQDGESAPPDQAAA